MKTHKIILAIGSMIISLGVVGAGGNDVLLDETTINDIPFNTSEIAATYLVNTPDYFTFQLDEEKYIDDIPFDTEKIANEYLYAQAFNKQFQLNDETYVKDIPFNTWEIYSQYQYDQFANKTEANVNDIPFNTELIAANVLLNSTELYLEDEKNVVDYPYCPHAVYCTNYKLIPKEVINLGYYDLDHLISTMVDYEKALEKCEKLQKEVDKKLELHIREYKVKNLCIESYQHEISNIKINVVR